MLWKGFYHDFSTKEASASGGELCPPASPLGALPPAPLRFLRPLTIYPGGAPAYDQCIGVCTSSSHLQNRCDVIMVTTYSTLCRLALYMLFAGAGPGFFKRGCAKIKDRQIIGACGDRECLRGDVLPQKRRKIVIFKVNLHDLVHSFCLGCPHKVKRTISAKRGLAGCATPSKSTPSLMFVRKYACSMKRCSQTITHVVETWFEHHVYSQSGIKVATSICNGTRVFSPKILMGGDSTGTDRDEVGWGGELAKNPSQNCPPNAELGHFLLF